MDSIYTTSSDMLTMLCQNIDKKIKHKDSFYDSFIKRDIVGLFHNAAEGARGSDKQWDMNKEDRALEKGFYAAADYMCTVGGYTPRLIEKIILEDHREEEHFSSIINDPKGFREAAVCVTYRAFRLLNGILTDTQNDIIGKLTSYCPSVQRHIRMMETIQAKKTEYRKKGLARHAS